MKIAEIDGIEVQAGPDAPEVARCPVCGEPVDLRMWRQGDQVSWYYRHARGRGSGCSQRLKEVGRCARTGSCPSHPELVAGDPYLVLAAFVVERTVEEVSRGEEEALLALAFSPLVDWALGMVGLTAEETWDELIADGGDGHPPDVRVYHNPISVLRPLREEPGPVLDLRGRPNGMPKVLIQSPWYVPLSGRLSFGQARMIQRVVERMEHVYVLGDHREWDRVVQRGSRGRELARSSVRRLNAMPGRVD
jgi:hypothetical protein